jgi:hypothetical protein
MSFTYRTSTVTPGEGEIHNVWGYQFRWTDKHQTEQELKPLLFSYDTIGAEVLDRIHQHKASNGNSVAGPAGRDDLFETVKMIALSKEDEVVNKFWQEVNSTPEWVDWEKIKRGQEVECLTFSLAPLADISKVFYRYGEALLIGGTFSSLLGGMVSF